MEKTLKDKVRNVVIFPGSLDELRKLQPRNDWQLLQDQADSLILFVNGYFNINKEQSDIRYRTLQNGGHGIIHFRLYEIFFPSQDNSYMGVPVFSPELHRLDHLS